MLAKTGFIMRPHHRAFLIWTVALSAVFVVLNWPRECGFTGRYRCAGFPIEFAYLDSGAVAWFGLWYLVLDVFVGLLGTWGVGYLCTRSWRKRQCGNGMPQPPPNPDFRASANGLTAAAWRPHVSRTPTELCRWKRMSAGRIR